LASSRPPGADGPIVEIRLTRRSVETLGLEPGREVYAAIKSIAFDHYAIAGRAQRRDK
jgi:TOBE domain